MPATQHIPPLKHLKAHFWGSKELHKFCSFPCVATGPMAWHAFGSATCLYEHEWWLRRTTYSGFVGVYYIRTVHVSLHEKTCDCRFPFACERLSKAGHDFFFPEQICAIHNFFLLTYRTLKPGQTSCFRRFFCQRKRPGVWSLGIEAPRSHVSDHGHLAGGWFLSLLEEPGVVLWWSWPRPGAWSLEFFFYHLIIYYMISFCFYHHLYLFILLIWYDMIWYDMIWYDMFLILFLFVGCCYFFLHYFTCCHCSKRGLPSVLHTDWKRYKEVNRMQWLQDGMSPEEVGLWGWLSEPDIACLRPVCFIQFLSIQLVVLNIFVHPKWDHLKCGCCSNGLKPPTSNDCHLFFHLILIICFYAMFECPADDACFGIQKRPQWLNVALSLSKGSKPHPPFSFQLHPDSV